MVSSHATLGAGQITCRFPSAEPPKQCLDIGHMQVFRHLCQNRSIAPAAPGGRHAGRAILRVLSSKIEGLLYSNISAGTPEILFVRSIRSLGPQVPRLLLPCCSVVPQGRAFAGCLYGFLRRVYE